MFLCGLSLSINKRANRCHVLIQDSCFLTMVFSEIKGFKCVVQPTFETHLKLSFGSLELRKQNRRKGFWITHL